MAVERARLSAASLGAPALVAIAVLGGLAAGYASLTVGVLPSMTLVVTAAVAVAALRSVWVLMGGALAVVTVLPFGVLPVSGPSARPTLFELAWLVVLGCYGALLLLDRRERVRTGGPQAWWIFFVGFVTFAFLLGLRQGYTMDILRGFFKLALALAVFLIVIQFARSRREAGWLVGMLMAGCGAAGAIALALYAGGPALTQRVLVRLVPYGYPSGRIVRYIEDDPARAMRAVGTGVDPNAFGGMMMVGLVLAVGQLLSRRRILPMPLILGVTAACGGAMMLTYSRGAWVGAAAGIGVLLWFRARRWLVPVGLFGAAVVWLGLGAGFVQRLWLGFTLQDPATKLRLQEYENALRIIQRHPWFGVGFGDAPSLDLQTGVSSTYLTVAEQAGLIGLALYLIVIGIVLWRGLVQVFRRQDEAENDLLLTVLAAFISALTVGLVDHYFINIRFPHMVAVFWLLAGLVVALTALQSDGRRREGES